MPTVMFCFEFRLQPSCHGPLKRGGGTFCKGIRISVAFRRTHRFNSLLPIVMVAVNLFDFVGDGHDLPPAQETAFADVQIAELAQDYSTPCAFLFLLPLNVPLLRDGHGSPFESGLAGLLPVV